MATVDQLLSVAESQLGVGETPPGSNVTPYSVWYGLIGPWCAMYCLWCAAQVGLKLPTHSAYVPTMYSQMVSADLWIPASEAGPGDFVMFNFDGGLLDHVGIVTDRIGSNAWATIEGNTDDVVRHHVRSPVYGYQMVFCRPVYDQPQPPETRKEDDMAMYEQYGTEAFFGDCWDAKFNYWLHTNGESANVVFHLLEHSSNIERHSVGQTVTKHQIHNISGVVMPTPMAPDNKPVKGSFTLRCTSDKPIHWTLREAAK